MPWQQRVREAAKTKIRCRTFAAFNCNIDVVIQVKQEDLDRIYDEQPRLAQSMPEKPTEVSPTISEEHLLAILQESAARGESHYNVVDLGLTDWIDRKFSVSRNEAGGEAAIIANQVAALGADSHVYTSVLSPRQAAVFHRRVKFPVISAGRVQWMAAQQVVNDNWTKLNYIFEFRKGATLRFGERKVFCPKAIQVILSTRDPRFSMAFDPQTERYLPDIGSAADVAFMAGYHHGRVVGRADTLDEYLALSISQLRSLCHKNAALALHFQYVPMTALADERRLLSQLTPEFASFSIEEQQLPRVLEASGFSELAAGLRWSSSPFRQYEAARTLFDSWRLERFHLRASSGQMVLVRKGYGLPLEGVRQACLFASLVNLARARRGKAPTASESAKYADEPVSAEGLRWLQQWLDEARAQGFDLADEVQETGTADMGGHGLALVPMHVEPDPVSTVALGDSLSASAYAAEISLVRAR